MRLAFSHFRVVLVLSLLSWISPAHAQVILYVAPAGAEGAAGTAEAPLTLNAALAKASASSDVTQIVLADGAYLVPTTGVSTPKGADPATLPVLTIRAANSGKAVLHSAVPLTDAQPVAGMPGLFRSKTVPPLSWQTQAPMMWERDTRVRYTILSNTASVAAFPASAFIDEKEGATYFSTSDGQPPAKHDLYLEISSGSLIYGNRSNTTFEGLTFKDHCAIGSALQTTGNNLIIRNCDFDNVRTAWSAGTDAIGNVMEDCTGVDVANPIHSYAKDIVVRRCRFEKARDRFMLPINAQDDTAYHVYSPGVGGVFEYNFAKGYRNGIFIKAGTGQYKLNHNTIIDAHWGIEWVTGNQGSDTSYNIVVNASEPLMLNRFAPDFTSDYNLVWKPGNWPAFGDRVDVIAGANRGAHNLLADPRFADPAHGDYRLLPDSPALALKDAQGAPAGAYGVAPPEADAQTPPTLALAFKADTRRAGRSGDLTFDRDPWIGGGTTSIRDLLDEDALPQRITGSPTFTVALRASDAMGKITTAKVRIGDAPPVEMPYDIEITPKLPEQDGVYPLEISVQSDRGIWSQPARAIIRLERQGPKLAAAPTIRASAHGLVFSFRASKPCFARIDYGDSTAYGQTLASSPLIRRNWNANDGGEWVQTWQVPREQFAIALIDPPAKDSTVHARITLTDEAGLSWTSEDITAKLGGAAMAWFVSPVGEDATAPGSGGTEAAPWRTIQYAVDRALPGDRVVLLPGVYTGSAMLNHGGTSDTARITIEAQKPGTVTLDSARREISLLQLERAPFVTVKGLRMLFYEQAGVYAYRSPNLRVEGCEFFNGLGWIEAYHVFCFYSPHSTVTHSTAIGGSIAFYFLESPFATVTHNTASQAMFGAAGYTFSAQGSVQMNNSFAFAGNDIYTLHWHHPDEAKTFRSDYNNLGTDVAGYHTGMDKSDPAQWALVTAEAVKGPSGGGGFPGGFRTVSKAVVGANERRVLTLKQWREESGQEKHSIFADPQHVSPMPPIDHWNWRVKPGSPNIGAGTEGSTMGAWQP